MRVTSLSQTQSPDLFPVLHGRFVYGSPLIAMYTEATSKPEEKPDRFSTLFVSPGLQRMTRVNKVLFPVKIKLLSSETLHLYVTLPWQCRTYHNALFQKSDSSKQYSIWSCSVPVKTPFWHLSPCCSNMLGLSSVLKVLSLWVIVRYGRPKICIQGPNSCRTGQNKTYSC